MLLGCFGGFAGSLSAEDDAHIKDHSDGFSIGYDLREIAGDFGMGMRIASPSFFKSLLSRRLVRAVASGHVAWAKNVVAQGGQNAKWLPYGFFKIGLSAGSFIGDLPIRISTPVEFVLITPSEEIASTLKLGLMGSADFEFFLNPGRSHVVYIAMGGLFAENLQGQSSIASGFAVSTGYRYYF